MFFKYKLIEKYIRNVREYFYLDEDDECSYIKERLIKAMGKDVKMEVY